MEQLDILLCNGPVLTMQPDTDPIANGYVGIVGTRIAAVGPWTDEVRDGLDAAETIDLAGRLVMPGFVNAHTHAAMTIFRGLADDLPLMEWLEHYIFPVERELRSEWVGWGTKLACLEMIAGGTTTFCDMYLFEQAAAEATAEAGLRALLGEVLYDFPSPNYGPPENGLAYTRELINTWRDHPRISIAVEPHAPYTCSPDLLKQCRDLAAEAGVPLITHLAETRHEDARIRETYGCSPVQHLENLGLLGPNLIADHVVHPDADDIQRLARRGVAVAHCPESNMKLASGAAPVRALINAGITVGLGTDGCASNNNLDMFEEMNAATNLQKIATMDPTALPAGQAVAMATRESATALHLARTTGQLTPGRAADLIVIDLDQPHLTPLYDLRSHLVYAARGRDVTHTMVDGRWLMRERRFTTLDPDTVRRAINDIAADIRTIVART